MREKEAREEVEASFRDVLCANYQTYGLGRMFSFFLFLFFFSVPFYFPQEPRSGRIFPGSDPPQCQVTRNGEKSKQNLSCF